MAAWRSSPRRALPPCRKPWRDIAAPADPTAPLVSSADVAIQNDGSSVILLETQNFPIEGVVQVRAAQTWGTASWITASYVRGDQATAPWRATNTFVKDYTTLQVLVITHIFFLLIS
jgi:hypothetical protein